MTDLNSHIRRVEDNVRMILMSYIEIVVQEHESSLDVEQTCVRNRSRLVLNERISIEYRV